MVERSKDPLDGVPPSRHPFEFWVLAASVVGGAATVLDSGQPASLVAVLPWYAVDLWGWITMIGGFLGLCAIFWPDRITGLLAERIALLAIGTALGIYGIVLAANAGLEGLVLEVFCASISIACFWRARHVHLELKTLAHWIERGR